MVLWTCFSKFYDYKKHLMRKKKYEGADEFPERGSSVLRIIKMLGGPNFNDEEFDEKYCKDKAGPVHLLSLPSLCSLSALSAPSSLSSL